MLAGYFGLFLAACVGLQAYTGAYAGDLGRVGDEAAHFVNSAMIHDYLVQGFGTNPVAFALEDHRHFPRVTIGHWPPVFHIVQACVFLLTGTSVSAALGFQAVIAGSAAALTATLVAPRVGAGWPAWVAGLAAGGAMLASPDLANQVSTVMLDTFMALLIMLTCLAWAAYARTGATGWALAFALGAGAAILTKGNAFGLGLMPAFYAMLSGRFAVLLRWRTWLAASVVAALTVPWYALTYRISAEGFVYSWGLAFTAAAIPAYSAGAWHALGGIALLGFFCGVVRLVLRSRRGDRDEVALACAAATMGMFLFQLVAPADIQPRYLIAVVPLVLIVAAVGLAAIVRGPQDRPLRALSVAGALAAGAALCFAPPRQSFHRMAEAAAVIEASGEAAPLVLVAAGPNGEGALIAAFAALDPARSHYVVRASKALATSNFSGSDYQPRFHSAADVGQWIGERRIGWLVLDNIPDSVNLLHNRQIEALVKAGQSGWQLVSEHRHRFGLVRVFRLRGPAPTAREIDAVLSEVAPTKLIGG